MNKIQIKVNDELVWEGDSGSVFVNSGNSSGNTIVINGQVINGGSPSVKLSINGDVIGDLKTDCSVKCKNVGKNIDAKGSVNCENVAGNIDAKGSVSCQSVTGNVQAGGSVNCGKVSGSVKAGGSIRMN